MSHAEPDFCLSASRLSFLSVTGMLFKELCARRLLSAGENEYITAYIFCQHFLKFFFIFFSFFFPLFFSPPPAAAGCPPPGPGTACAEGDSGQGSRGSLRKVSGQGGLPRPGRGCRTAMEPWPKASARGRAPRATERRNSGSRWICAVKNFILYLWEILLITIHFLFWILTD